MVLRPGMDVFNVDQSRFIGTVIGVVAGGTVRTSRQAGGVTPKQPPATHAYATEPEGEQEAVTWLIVRPGRINLGPLTRSIYVPASSIRGMSMERIVVSDMELSGR